MKTRKQEKMGKNNILVVDDMDGSGENIVRIESGGLDGGLKIGNMLLGECP